jgi:hypothetical protein
MEKMKTRGGDETRRDAKVIAFSNDPEKGASGARPGPTWGKGRDEKKKYYKKL